MQLPVGLATPCQAPPSHGSTGGRHGAAPSCRPPPSPSQRGGGYYGPPVITTAPPIPLVGPVIPSPLVPLAPLTPIDVAGDSCAADSDFGSDSGAAAGPDRPQHLSLHLRASSQFIIKEKRKKETNSILIIVIKPD